MSASHSKHLIDLIRQFLDMLATPATILYLI